MTTGPNCKFIELIGGSEVSYPIRYIKFHKFFLSISITLVLFQPLSVYKYITIQ